MAQFYEGKELSKQIKEICDSDNLKVACAFIGEGFREHLLKNQKNKPLKLICDISMGATNPKELKKLGAPKKKNLKHIDNFHAKVFMSDAGVVVGSANASKNGIGWTNDARNHEAGVYYAHKGKIFEQTEAWFDNIWNEAHLIDSLALKQLTNRYNEKNGEQSKSLSLVDFIKNINANPSEYNKFGFVIVSNTTSTKDEIRLKKQESNIQKDKNNATMRRKNHNNHYSGWNKKEAEKFPRKCIEIDLEATDLIVKAIELGTPFEDKDKKSEWCARCSNINWNEARLSMPGLPQKKEFTKNTSFKKLAEEYDQGMVFVNGAEFAKAFSRIKSRA